MHEYLILPTAIGRGLAVMLPLTMWLNDLLIMHVVSAECRSIFLSLVTACTTYPAARQIPDTFRILGCPGYVSVGMLLLLVSQAMVVNVIWIVLLLTYVLQPSSMSPPLCLSACWPSTDWGRTRIQYCTWGSSIA